MKKKIMTIIASIVVAFSTMLNIIPVQNMAVVRAETEDEEEAIRGLIKYVKKNGERDNENRKYYWLNISLGKSSTSPSISMSYDGKNLEVAYHGKIKVEGTREEDGHEITYMSLDSAEFTIRKGNKCKFMVNDKNARIYGEFNKYKYSGNQNQIKYNSILLNDWSELNQQKITPVSKSYAKKEALQIINKGLKNINKTLKNYTDYTLYDLGFENY